MEVKDVAVPKGTTHLVSKEDFCSIVGYEELKSVDVPAVDVQYVLATRDGKDLIVTRTFTTGEEADKFKAFLGTKIGVKVI